jgi:trans-aconitate 2-methyltransferase
MSDLWDAKMYSEFLDLRTRPARDLLSVIPDFFDPKIIYDMGCGPGNSTILLKNRWPEAAVVGLDSSLNMLKQAKSMYPDLDFIEGNIAYFEPTEKIDLLFANASLQWIDQHETLFPTLLQYINKGGAFGIQMPNNFHSPSHQATVRILQSNTNWKPLLKKLIYGILSEPLYRLSWYYDVFIKAGISSPQLWETEYIQEMSDHQAVFDWGKGTGLRPILSAMDAENQAQFTKEYVNAIAQDYPLQANNRVLMSFKRVFMVGFKTS